jgi:hypothetical protein
MDRALTGDRAGRPTNGRAPDGRGTLTVTVRWHLANPQDIPSLGESSVVIRAMQSASRLIKETDDKVYRCACEGPEHHVFTAATTKPFIVIVDPEKERLLKDTGWNVSRVHYNSKRLQARATTMAPGIRKGRTLHRLVMGAHNRRVRALNGNLLDARKRNLQTVSRSDISILNRGPTITKLAGVHRAEPPRWLKSDNIFHASINVGGTKLHLGSFKTPEEGAAAYDAAAIRAFGNKTTTNVKLGLLCPKVARAKVCRQRAKKARNIVKAHQLKVAPGEVGGVQSCEDQRRTVGDLGVQTGTSCVVCGSRSLRSLATTERRTAVGASLWRQATHQRGAAQ